MIRRGLSSPDRGRRPDSLLANKVPPDGPGGVPGPAHFRAAMGHFASGVVVITAMEGAEPVGFTCQSFFSASLDPPLVAFAVARTSVSWPRVERAGRFCASILAADQVEVCQAFARSGTDKFAVTTWSLSPAGSPIIEGSLAWVDCTLLNVHDAGDHQIAIGQVTGLHSSPGQPLVFFLSHFYSALDEPVASSRVGTGANHRDQGLVARRPGRRGRL